MYIFNWNLSNDDEIQLIQNFYSDHAWGAAEFYLNMAAVSPQQYYDLINCSWVAFQSGKTSSSDIGDFYCHIQKSKEMECWLTKLSAEIQVLIKFRGPKQMKH